MTPPKKKASARAGAEASESNDKSTFHRDHNLTPAIPREEPEFGTSRRRFLIAMFMCGAVKPERVVERIVAEVDEDSHGG